MLQRLGSYLVKFKSTLAGAVERVLSDKLQDTVSVKDFGAKGDGVTDDTSAFKAALRATQGTAVGRGTRLFAPSGTYKITDTLEMVGATHYSRAGATLIGDGRSKTILMFSLPTKKECIRFVSQGGSEDGYNYELKHLNVKCVRGSASHGVRVTVGMSGGNFDGLILSGQDAGLWMDKNAWINSFIDIMFDNVNHGLYMNMSGTTNFFDRLFAYGINKIAYRISCSYSTIGSLAADNCIGTVYDLSFFGGSVNSLGCESPDAYRTPTTILNCDNGKMTVNKIFGFRVVPTDGREFTGVYLGTGYLTLGYIELGAQNPNTASLNVNGTVIKGYRGRMSLTGNILAIRDTNKVHAQWSDKLVFTKMNPTNSFIDQPVGKLRGGCKPVMQLDKHQGWDSKLDTRVLQTIICDNYNSLRGTGVDDSASAGGDQWTPGSYARGSIGLENDPATNGTALYVVTQQGVDMNSHVTARVGFVQVVGEVSKLPNTGLYDGRKVAVGALHKTLTYHTYGDAGWYDEAGAKIA